MSAEPSFFDDIARVYRYSSGTHLRKVIECFSSPGLQAIGVYRFGRLSRRWPLIFRILTDPLYIALNFLVKVLWGIELPRSATIGSGFYIGHFGGIVISSGAIFGKNCNISQGVTIGLSGKGERCGIPVIGDDVYIAPGAKIFGKINIGSNAKIGANAVVYKDIPENAVVVLNPGFSVISMTGNRPLGDSSS
jgi:serine O-acetyltransferase